MVSELLPLISLFKLRSSKMGLDKRLKALQAKVFKLEKIDNSSFNGWGNNSSSTVVVAEAVPAEVPPQNPNQEQTSPLAAFLCILNVKLGSALLAVPYASQQAGLVTSLVMMALFVGAVIVSCIVCTELAIKTKVDSYHKLVKAYCNDYVFQLTQSAILLIVFGRLIASIELVGDQSDRLFSALYGHDFCYTHWYLNRWFIMIAATYLLIVPLCCIRTVSFMKFPR